MYPIHLPIHPSICCSDLVEEDKGESKNRGAFDLRVTTREMVKQRGREDSQGFVEW